MKNQTFRRFILLIILLLSITSISICSADDNVNVVDIVVTSYTTQIAVSWKEVRGAEKYEVQYAAQGDASGTIKETSSTRLEIMDLKTETVYYIKIRVYNDSKWSDWSETQSCKTASFKIATGTYNILSSRYDSVFPNNVWKERKYAMRDIIIQPNNNPDIFGIQEGMEKVQVMELASLLKNAYDFHISHRDISPRAIFWQPEKYSLVAFDDNIEVLDNSVSGHTSQRYVTCVRLKEKNTGKEFFVINLHAPSSFYKNMEMEREILATIVSNKAKALSEAANHIPVILLGDLNSYPHSPVGELPTASMVLTNNGFTDTFSIAADKINAYYGTHDRITTGIATSGQKAGNCSKRIDYIFTYPADRVTVSDYSIIINFTDNSGTVLKKPIPSDHRPVRCTIHLHY